MLIVIFGESCTGKSTIAQKICDKLPCKVYSGKDFLRLAKNENDAKIAFKNILANALNGDNIIYVIAERAHLSLVPDGAIRVLCTADLELIKSRFATRMRGFLPPPVEKMLISSHGVFDNELYDIHFHQSVDVINTDINAILELIKNKSIQQ